MTKENFLSRLVHKANMSKDEAQTMTNDLFFVAVDTVSSFNSDIIESLLFI